jgi:hypothetical protein
MKVVGFTLEIYEPGSADDIWIVFESSTPFMSINRGDILNPAFFSNSQSPMKVLRVINVEHILWEVDGNVMQKILIFTEEVEGTRELRLNRE